MFKFSAALLPRIRDIYFNDDNLGNRLVKNENLFIFAISGNASFEVGKNNCQMHKGDVLIIPSNTSFCRLSQKNSSSLCYVSFDLPYDEISTKQAQNEIIKLKESEEYVDYFYVFNHLNVGESYKKILEYLSEMISVYNRKYGLAKTNVSQIFGHVISSLSIKTQDSLQKYSEVESMGKMPLYLKQAVYYIKTHISQRITLEKLSEIAKVSQQQLIRSFKKYFGKTPNDYITDYKMDKAKSILVEPNSMSIKEIASELGYVDQCYFTRVFVKFTGENPSAYSKRVKSLYTSQYALMTSVSE